VGNSPRKVKAKNVVFFIIPENTESKLQSNAMEGVHSVENRQDRNKRL